MFSKILIANRGEIACRVITTARRLGIRTVAVYSDADANARHVRLADEAVRIGASPARESYLVIDALLDAARRTRAEAIHPGYGFLAESEAFAEACEREGIIFIGPPASAIRAMGSKSAAKSLMERAGVPMTPGYHGDRQEPSFLAEQASNIGYPVLIKASAGGGGKGMRRVDAPSDFEAALVSCKREASGAFGDDAVLVEKYVLSPRHIEIQVFADRHGQCVSLFERDCSVQRRHQKVLEEAPAPGMTPERRVAMGRAAVDAAKAVGYVGAGTVEFIVEPDGGFYFMEMNTRLQVEHPVTEMITGLDLVEWQLRVAAGEPLPRREEELVLSGHAIEARIYAEDPSKGFLPSTGTLAHLSMPASPDVRIDSGVEQGDEITPFYDPMVAKLIVRGADRREALTRMRAALDAVRIVGVASNVEFLGRVVRCASFAEAKLDTGLIERETPFLFPESSATSDDTWLLAALGTLLAETRAAETRSDSPWAARDGFRLNGRATRSVALRNGGVERSIEVAYESGGFELKLGDRRVFASGVLSDASTLLARLDDHRLDVGFVAVAKHRHVFLEGRNHAFECVDPFVLEGQGDEGHHGLRSPMPGRIVAFLVPAESTVERGAPLLVMEAMKMEHTITAPSRGIVTGFLCAPGDQVKEGVELVDFEAAP